MKLALHNLYSAHPKLHGYPADLPRLGGLALQRAGHSSPVHADVNHSGKSDIAEIEWLLQELALLEVLDRKRVTEDGAEAVALAYVASSEGWTVKRRLQASEKADWLLRKEKRWLALEVSGTAEGNPVPRLKEKVQQVASCTLQVERLALVVAFDRPSILVDAP